MSRRIFHLREVEMWLDLLVIVACFVVFGRASNYLIEGLVSVRAAEQHGVARTLRGDGADDTHHTLLTPMFFKFVYRG